MEVEGLHSFYVTANGKNFYLVKDGVDGGP
ncbi:MAG: hypothetical protein JRJ35_10510 [Deltaproteobacteria bacterium]|nr:hypothetical protein [Deltaproteobacteria bacterium]MBW1948911.1 hypothetical protein [Deltaproteobacteria bacterium]RLB35452.1 MAG: hypothetical protein DRH20_11040 [Deltaproteobacteria bacterium]